MPYRLRRSSSEYMAPEECHVFDALKHFCFEPEDTTVRDFCPTSVLYNEYVAFMDRGGFAEILNPQQFGVALRRVFGIDPERKTRRTYQGRNVKGYYHVRGPGSIVSHEGRGNPKLIHARRQETTAVEAPAPGPDDFEARFAAARAAAAED